MNCRSAHTIQRRPPFYLKKAGIADPKILLQASDAAFNGAVDEGALFQASAAKAGIKVDLKKEPADGFWDNVWLKGAFVSSYWGGRAAATQMLSVAYEANATWNETHWNNATFEKLLSDARSETDEAKRKPYIWEMQEMLHEQGGAIIPVFRDWLDAHNEKVGGHTPHGGFDMDNGYDHGEGLAQDLTTEPRPPSTAGAARIRSPSSAWPPKGGSPAGGRA